MDIIDIMLARAMTPQGKTEIYLNKANKAAAKAEAAESSAEAAVATVNAAAEDITAAQSAAEELLATAQEALETAQEAQINTLDTEDVDDEIKKMDVSVNLVEGQNANTYQVITTYPDNTLNTENATKMYKSTGQNEDGTMTQKAITNALNTKADTSALNSKADKTYVDQQIQNINISGGGTNIYNYITNLGVDAQGHIVIIDKDGNINVGEPMEREIIEALIRLGIYEPTNALGLDINYQDKTTIRIYEATGLEMGTDFDNYPMYGGRMRCNVADDGTINAFYGEEGYADDGSNGQVMVYQPKFYYQRLPLQTELTMKGKIVRHETILITTEKQSGFKLHPLFIDEDGEELDYVLLAAYEGSVINNTLCSISGQKPTSYMTVAEAEEYANTRGTGWHITNLASESALQMLEIVEFGNMNGQYSIEAGVSNITTKLDTNCASLTGSTAELGNATGHATSTINEIDGTITEYSAAGYRAISYRGMENPWGNIWRMIGGVNLYGDARNAGGEPYICLDYNYIPNQITADNYESLGFNIPNDSNWISAMGYGKEKFDWVLMPIECAKTANSQLPVGDCIWTKENLTETEIMVIGGSCGFLESNGPFSYGGDRNLQQSAMHNYNARLMYIPTKNNIYEANITKWNNMMEAD